MICSFRKHSIPDLMPSSFGGGSSCIVGTGSQHGSILFVGSWNPQWSHCWEVCCPLAQFSLKCKYNLKSTEADIQTLFWKISLPVSREPRWQFLWAEASVLGYVIIGTSSCQAYSTDHLFLLCISRYFIFTSFWAYKIYYVYGFMLLVFLILAIVTVCVTIVCTYFLLNAEDYRW